MSDPSSVRVSGPLQPYAAGFRGELRRLGYRPNAASVQLRRMAHLSRWLDSCQVEPDDLTDERVDEFLADRRAGGYTILLSPKATDPLLVFLRGLGVVPARPPRPPGSVGEELVEAFEAYLLAERGLANATTVSYVSVARLFLAGRASGEADLVGLAAGEVTGFVLAEVAHRSVGSAQFVACGLRAFLRFAYATGRTDSRLDGAVPKIASSRLSRIPRSISATDVEALLASCDRRTTSGRRDLPALLLMVRLGLRAGEVAALDLGDISWRSGEIVVRGKASRVERLPLPADVGEAISGWLARGWRRCDSAAVFTRVRAPHRRLSPGGVGAIVRAAAARAGLSGINAHRLRHTAATAMLARGADLAEVGQVLRHRSMTTTAIYAKVDDLSLRPLALAWPIGARR